MKTLSIYAVVLFSILSANHSFAQNSIVKETIKVWGNCGMCKKTIERSAKAGGAATATWNKDTKELSVSYASSKINGSKIQEAIAKSGYDTQDFTADENAYNALSPCCQYERKKDAPAKKDGAFNSMNKACCENLSAGK